MSVKVPPVSSTTLSEQGEMNKPSRFRDGLFSQSTYIMNTTVISATFTNPDSASPRRPCDLFRSVERDTS
jgi:hypothetical protein